MLDARLDELAALLHADLIGPAGARVTGVSTDSRRVQPGDLFFAIRGERFDGHAFVSAALAAGAAAAVVDGARLAELDGCAPLLVVNDPLRALSVWGEAHRSRLPVRVIGVTGSVGKTTTKDLLAAVLARRYRTLANQGSLNAEIGLPLTLLQLSPEHEVAVLEMAMRGAGQIRELTDAAHPEIGVITCIGLSHLELLGSQEAIARAKAELLEALPPQGMAILPADDAFLPLLREKSPRAITFGFSDAADVRGELLPSSEDGARFRVHAPRWLEAPLEASIPLLGRHNVANALAVTAAALHLDVPPAAIAAGLAGAVTSKMRMQVHRLADGTILLDDAYNASSPIAMEAALAVLAEQRGGRRAVAVLGDMLELGAASESAHAQVGRAVANLAPTLLVTAGPRAHGIAESARDAGLAAERVVAGADNDAALAVLRERLRPGDIILVKGSRGMAMESIVEALLRDQGDDR